MDARARNLPVVIERPTDDEDSMGQRTPSWLPLADEWASILHPTGISVVKAGSPTGVVAVSIRIGYRTDVRTDMRVRDVDSGDIYKIGAVLPDKARKLYTDLVCELVQ